MSKHKSILAPPLIIVREASFVTCGMGGDIDSWLNRDIMRRSNEFVIRDPDGSLWRRHAKKFSSNRFALKDFNLSNIRFSARYNPLEYINDDYGVHKLADAIISGTEGLGKPGDINFLSVEAMLLTALITYAHLEAPDFERNIGLLLEILKHMILDYYEEGFVTAVDLVFENLAETVPGNKASQLYSDFKVAVGDEDAMHIAASCSARLAALNTTDMLDLLANDELRLNSLTYPQTALFVIGKPKKGHEFLIPLLYSQLFDALHKMRVR